MFPRITNVRHLEEFKLEVTFSDGVCAEIDFWERIKGRGGVFEPLQQVEFFKRVRVDQEAGTLVWPNDVDLDPDMLYSIATGMPIAQSVTA